MRLPILLWIFLINILLLIQACATNAIVTDTSNTSTEVYNLTFCMKDCPYDYPAFMSRCYPEDIRTYCWEEVKLKSGETEYLVPLEQITTAERTFDGENLTITTKKGTEIVGILIPNELYWSKLGIDSWYFYGDTEFGDFTLPATKVEKILTF
jgi:hypothetical protein